MGQILVGVEQSTFNRPIRSNFECGQLIGTSTRKWEKIV